MARASTFTTYIGAKTDSSVNSEFDKLAQVAVSRYSTVARAAEAAGRATAGVFSSSSVAGASTITRALDQQARAANSVAAGFQKATVSATGMISSVRSQGAAAQVAANHNEALARSLKTTATALTVVQGPLGPIAGRVSALASAVERLTGFRLGLVGVGATLFTIGRLGNDYANLNARLRPYYDTQQQANQAMSDVVGIAGRARSALEPVVGLYARLTALAPELGISRFQVGRTVETASKLSTLSGGAADVRAAGLVQFSQALGRGNLQGQDLRAIEEDIPELARAIAKGFQNADGSIGIAFGDLKKLGEQGKISAEQIIGALNRVSPEVERRFATLPKTLTSASTEFKNAIEVMVGRFDQASGFTSGLAEGLSLVANNLRAITGLAIGVGVAFASSRAAPTIADLTDKIKMGIVTIQREQAEIRGNAIARMQYAKEAQQEAAAEVAQREAALRVLNQENAALLERTAILQQQKIAADQTVAIARGSTFGRAPAPNTGGLGITTGEAEFRAAAATRALATEQEKLRTVQNALHAEGTALAAGNLNLAGATARAGEAVAAGVPKTGLLVGALGKLKVAGMGIVNLFGGPWGLAIGAAATALYLLATAETAAEAAARKNEDAQRSFASAVDATTGKVYAQIRGLELQARARQQADAAVATQGQFKDAKGQYLAALAPLLGRTPLRSDRNYVGDQAFIQRMRQDTRTPEQRQLNTLAQSFAAGKAGSYQALDAYIKEHFPNAEARAPGLGGRAIDLNARYFGGTDSRGAAVIGVRQAEARARVLAGNARPGDTALANGDPTALHNTVKPKTPQQIAADAATKAAQTELERARADLKQIKANRNPGESDDAYEDRLAAAMQRVTAAQQAQTSARHDAAAGRAAERRQVRDAIVDATDEAKAKRDAALLALAKGPLAHDSDAYIQARIKILSTYDDEVNAINTSRAASHSAVEQEIADANKLASTAKKNGETLANILSATTDDSKPVQRARRQIIALQRLVGQPVDGAAFLGQSDDQVEQIKKANPLGTAILTQGQADEAEARVRKSLLKPLDDIIRDGERQVEINRLILQGRDAEAAALQRAFGLYDDIGALSQAEYAALVRNEEQQLRINDALASRARVVDAITAQLTTAREGFTNLLVDIGQGKGADAFKSYFTNLKDSILRATAQQLTEKIFAGSDAKLRALLSGKSSVDTAIGSFAESLHSAETSTDRITSAWDRAVDALNAATDRISTAQASGGSGGGLDAIANSVAGGNAVDLDSIISTAAAAATSALGLTPASIAATGGENGSDVVVTASRAATQAITQVIPQFGASPLNTRAGASAGIGSLFSGLDRLVDSISGKTALADGTITKGGSIVSGSKFFSGLSDAVGKGFKGAATGDLVAGISNAVGIHLNKTGSEIGGAIGSFIPIPGGDIIGSVIGGVIGNFLAKKKIGQSTLGLSSSTGEVVAGAATGNDAASVASAAGEANGVAAALNNITQTLGATFTGLPQITVGSYKGKYRVNDHGTDLKSNNDVMEYTDEQDAINFAIKRALQLGVINGISEASKRILTSGQDLTTALNKALAIENIPKQLKALNDPVGAAVDALNLQFKTLIGYLKEGGATAGQFADAQELYDKSRAAAIKQATDQASQAINQFLKDMIGSSASPLNKKDTYDNAAAVLNSFKGDIASGKSVDQSELLAAAKNFQDASRALYGSSDSFFQDFDTLRALLGQARDNAIKGAGDLAASPFAAADIQSIISATGDQTTTLLGGLNGVIGAVEDLTAYFQGRGFRVNSALDLLPGYG